MSPRRVFRGVRVSHGGEEEPSNLCVTAGAEQGARLDRSRVKLDVGVLPAWGSLRWGGRS